MAEQRVAGNAWTDAHVSTVTSVTASATVVTLLAANGNRLGGTIYNDTDVACYVKFGSDASTTSFTVKLHKKDAEGVGGFLNLNDALRVYVGIITAIWDAAPVGAARVTELT